MTLLIPSHRICFYYVSFLFFLVALAVQWGEVERKEREKREEAKAKQKKKKKKKSELEIKV